VKVAGNQSNDLKCISLNRIVFQCPLSAIELFAKFSAHLVKQGIKGKPVAKISNKK